MQTLTLIPINNKLLIAPDQPDALTTGGIYIPQSAQEEPTQGCVVACSDHTNLAHPLKLNDKVVFAKHSGVDVKLNGKTLKLLSETDVFGVLQCSA